MKTAQTLSAFDVALTSLPNGEHRYHYRLDGDFFGLFEASLIKKADIEVDCTLFRQGNRMDVRVLSKGAMDLPCDRCLEPLAWPVEDESVLVVQLTEAPAESNDEILYLPLGETRLNLAHYFYENIHLHLPLRAVCGESGLPCQAPSNFEALSEGAASKTPATDQTDPRWEQLKQINFS
ncbi:MAG: DUF177 domain-containing protein [Cytophagia bacterium]|nr:DUF177 domain-containing protein [Cytophagia bacterium]